MGRFRGGSWAGGEWAGPRTIWGLEEEVSVAVVYVNPLSPPQNVPVSLWTHTSGIPGIVPRRPIGSLWRDMQNQ